VSFHQFAPPLHFYNRYVFDFASQSVLLAKKNGTSRNLRTLGEISASLCEISARLCVELNTAKQATQSDAEISPSDAECIQYSRFGLLLL